MYLYHLRNAEDAQRLPARVRVGALLLRTMAYLVFKRFAEVDPAKAHAKLTHERLAGLPVPRVDFGDPTQAAAHRNIVANVRKLLNGKAELAGEEDREIEQILRDLWGLTGEDGAYINGEFHDLPDSQVIRDLFPGGPPPPIVVGE